MSSERLEISSEFTENVALLTVHPCQRCQKNIQPGEERNYIAPLGQTNQPGRYVCTPCKLHYLKKGTTRTRTISTPRTATPSIVNHNGILEHSSAVRSLINESQRRGAHTPEGRVTAMPAHFSSQNLAPSSNPLVFKNYFSSISPQSAPDSASRPATGYSQSHLQYSDEREKWSTAAYKSAPDFTIHRFGSGQVPINARSKPQVHILAHVEYNFQALTDKRGKTPIKEGLTVDYMVAPNDLAKAILNVLVLPLQKFRPGFAWDSLTMEIREVTLWVNILNRAQSIMHVPVEPYFHGRFLKAKTGAKADGSFMFSVPLKPINFVLLIDREQWLRADDFLELQTQHIEDVAQSHMSTRARRTDIFDWQESSTANSSKAATPDASASRESDEVHDYLLSSAVLRPKTPEIMSQSSKRKAPPSPHKTMVPPEPKKTLTQPLSISHVQRTQVSLPKSIFVPLGLNQVQNGIILGGQLAILEQKNHLDSKLMEHFFCYMIREISFQDICAGDHQLVDREGHPASLSYDPKADYIGRGAFKTTHLATIKWMSMPPSNAVLGADTATFEAALKRPFDSIGGRIDKNSIKRFNFADESRKVLIEGTSLGYAAALLRFAYAFIEDFISNNKTDSTPPLIPQFRFVKGAIAYSERQVKTALKSASTNSTRAAYLLEELIPNKDEFIKYIHNDSATPLQEKGEKGYETGEFLCFIQHIQYHTTHGQVYLSDFQGTGELLTDPQVMTHPSLLLNENMKVLFGDGNVGSAFEGFESQHICNSYCQWFNLKSFVGESNVEGPQEDPDDDIYV